jgi:hypothetical protein
MKLSFDHEYMESWIPPRCRKARNRRLTAKFEGEIAEITAAEAPVAIRMRDQSGFGDFISRHATKLGRNAIVDFRWYNEKLYCLCRRRAFMCLSGWLGEKRKLNRLAIVKDIHFSVCNYSATKEEVQEALDKQLGEYLLIDGQLHEQVGEPRYVIGTYGLGGNHGLGWGTSIGVDEFYNSNIPWHRYFRIDQEKECNEAGRKIAAKRGDTKAFPHFDKRIYERFEIFIPEAVRLNPKAEHGDGDPFLNKLDAITEIGDPVIAGFAVMAAAFQP